jgi:hypothetical protein
MNTTESFIGKPVTIYAKGKRRVIGSITSARVVDNSVQFAATIDDAEVAKLLGIEIASKIDVQVSDVTTS